MDKPIYVFGPYRLDTLKRVLWLGEEPVPITPREFHILFTLAKREGEAVGRPELIKEVWSDANISDGDNNLSKQIGSLRKKLEKDEAGQDYIRTVPNQGYFLAARPESLEQTKALLSNLWVQILAGGVLVAVVALIFLWPRTHTVKAAVAVLQFRDHQIDSKTGPLAPIVTEWVRTELSAGQGVRVASGEETGRMIKDIGLPATDSLGTATLERVRRYLLADYVVSGSVTQAGAADEVRVDLVVQDARTGETVGSESAVGQKSSLFNVVSRCGALLRNRLGVGKISSSDAQILKEEAPANLEAARLYAEGLAQMRAFEPIKARESLESASREDPRSAMIHSALAEVWATLGYEQKAKDEARQAFDLSSHLSRENQLIVEGRYREFAREGARAMDVYQALATYYPGELEYGLRLVRSRIKFGKEAETAATIASLRAIPAPYKEDPRIDLVEAEAAENRGDFKAELKAANQAMQKAEFRKNRFLVAKGQLKACWALDYLGDREKALQLAKEAQKTFQSLGDKGDEAIATKNIADVLDDGGHHAEAIPVYEQAAKQFQEAGSMTGFAITLNNSGYAMKDLGDLGGAQDHFQHSVQVCREIGDKNREAQALNGLAGVLKRRGQLAEAQKIYEEELARMEQTNQLNRAGTVLNNLAEIFQMRGRLSEAQQHFEKSKEVAKSSGDRTSEARTLGNLGDLALLRGDLATAQKDFEDQLAIGKDIKEEKQRGYALDGLGRVCYERGDPKRSKEFLDQALAIRNAAGEKDLAAETRLSLSELNPIRSELEEIKRVFKQENRPDEQAEAEIGLLRCALRAQLPDLPTASISASQLQAALPKLQDASIQMEVRTALAEYGAAKGQPAAALKELQEVQRMASESGFVLQELETELTLVRLLRKQSERVTLLNSVQRKAESRAMSRIAKQALALY